MNRLIAVTEPVREEILSAVESIKRPNSIFVSRAAIENEIADHPGKYPILGGASTTFQRQAITKVMKRRFSYWGDSTSSRRATFVWDITRMAEGRAHV